MSNWDTVPFHVNDIEILSTYSANESRYKALGLPMMFENEKSVAYQLGNQDLNGNVVTSHGPLVVELIEGDKVFVSQEPLLQPATTQET